MLLDQLQDRIGSCDALPPPTQSDFDASTDAEIGTPARGAHD
jgi:hypothetical protein